MKRAIASFVVILAAIVSTESFGEKNGHDPSGTSDRPGAGGKSDGPASGECSVNGQAIVDFANGESYQFGPVVELISGTNCAEKASEIGRGLISQITFYDKSPYRLDGYAKKLAKDDPGQIEQVQKTLTEKIPDWLRRFPLTNQELLPIVGQLSVLSAPAARIALANVIAADLVSTARGMNLSQPGWEKGAKSLANRLVQMGANEGPIASELAGYVEQLALLVQADALGKFFTSLGAAAAFDKKIAATFNVTAGAFNQGVQSGMSVYTQGNKSDLLRAVFDAIYSAVTSKANVEVGAADLNEALASLIEGKTLSVTSLKKLYKEAVKILAENGSQPALAEAVASSVTPEYLYLKKDEVIALVAAANNYLEVAASLQENLRLGWQRNWDSLHEGKLKVGQFNDLKAKFFEPMVEQLLEIDPASIGHAWMREMINRGLVKERSIEKRFPKMVLAVFQDRDRRGRSLSSDDSWENELRTIAIDLHQQWALQRVYLPALFKWVDSHD